MVKALETGRRTLGEEHRSTLYSMNLLGFVYCEQGQFDKAEALLVKALDLRRRILGEEHKDTLGSMMGLGWLYVKQALYDKAEPLAVTVYSGRSAKFGSDHVFTQDAIQILIKLYEAWDKREDAEKWRAKFSRNQDAQEQ